MTAAIPGVLRAAMLAERAARIVYDRCAALTQRVALSAVPDRERAGVTEAIYARLPSFAPGSADFSRGLFPWEEEALAHPGFPRSGHLLVGGAGGGREVVALARRGYTALGFEPSEVLVRLGERTVAEFDGCALVRGSYEELVATLREGAPALRRVADNAPYDAVVLGWGSLTHVLDVGMRSALFAALRQVAPRGPVLLSYMRHAAPRDARGDTGGIVRFASHAGYYRTISEPELFALAESSGYEVAVARTTPYAHALLVPRPARPNG